MCAVVVPMARTGALLPVAAAAGLGALAFAIAAMDPSVATVAPIARVRFAAVVAGLGAGFALEDPAETSVAAVPTPLAVRRLVRVGLVSLILAGWWLVLAEWASSLSRELPRQALGVELASIVGVSLGAAAFGGRSLPAAHRGVVGAGAVLVLAATALQLPPDLALYLSRPDHPGWEASHWRWAAIGGLAIAALTFTSRDPARRRRSGRSD